MMKQLASGLLVALFPLSAANAADVWTAESPTYPVITSSGVHDWSGVYAGLNGGYAFGEFRFGPITLDPGGTFDVFGSPAGAGWIGGGQAGVNLQHGSLVFGIEGDIQYAGVDADRSIIDGFPNPGQGDVTTVDLRLSSFGTVRGRVGVAVDRWLAFATGGLVIGHAEGVVNVTDAGTYDQTASDANTHYGYAVGGGVEYALNGNWSIKGEYLYTSFGAQTYELSFPIPGPSTIDASIPLDFSMHVIRLGLNYNF